MEIVEMLKVGLLFVVVIWLKIIHDDLERNNKDDV